MSDVDQWYQEALARLAECERERDEAVAAAKLAEDERRWVRVDLVNSGRQYAEAVSERAAAIREREEALASAHGLTLLVGEAAAERDALRRTLETVTPTLERVDALDAELAALRAQVARQQEVVEAARKQSAASELLWSDSDDDDNPHLIEWERATDATEAAIRALDAAGEVCCDGDHGEPACSDATCWQLDSREVNRG